MSKKIFGYIGIKLITIATAVSMFGGLSGAVFANPRVLFAGARDGIFPRFLGKVHPKYITPHYAIIVYTTIGYFFAVFGAFKQLFILTTASTLIIYLGVVLATIRLRYKKSIVAEKTFTIPGGIIVPLLAAIFIIWLLSNLSKSELISIGIALLVLSIIYGFMKLYNNKQIPLIDTKVNH